MRLLHMQCARQQISVVPLNATHQFSSAAATASLIYSKSGPRDLEAGLDSAQGLRYMTVLTAGAQQMCSMEQPSLDRFRTVCNYQIRDDGAMQLAIGACAEVLRTASDAQIADLLLLTRLHIVAIQLQVVLPLTWRAQPVQQLSKTVSSTVAAYVDNWCAHVVNICAYLESAEERGVGGFVQQGLDIASERFQHISKY